MKFEKTIYWIKTIMLGLKSYFKIFIAVTIVQSQGEWIMGHPFGKIVIWVCAASYILYVVFDLDGVHSKK